MGSQVRDDTQLGCGVIDGQYDQRGMLNTRGIQQVQVTDITVINREAFCLSHGNIVRVGVECEERNSAALQKHGYSMADTAVASQDNPGFVWFVLEMEAVLFLIQLRSSCAACPS